MFSKKEQLLRKTGPDGIGRYDFLRLLKKEFNETKQDESKKQVLANLANFSYDPINYDYMRDLKLIELFLEQLCFQDEEHKQYAIAALCNLSSDPRNREIIIRQNGIELITLMLYSSDIDVVLNTITTLMFLKTSESEHRILTGKTIEKLEQIKKNSNPRLRNLATLFLENIQK